MSGVGWGADCPVLAMNIGKRTFVFGLAGLKSVPRGRLCRFRLTHKMLGVTIAAQVLT